MDPLPTPRQLFRQYDAGEITREAFHAAMRQHQEMLIEEMEEAHQNPVAAAIEEMRRRYAAAKLLRRHNEEELREIFVALSELADFSPAHHLWNAAHRHVPVRVFFRPGKEPVFRVLELKADRWEVCIRVEHGAAARRQATREEIHFQRDDRGELILRQRRRLS